MFQLVARDHPPHGDDVHPISIIAVLGRGPAVRARHRHLPRDGALLVEPLRPYVRRGDPEDEVLVRTAELLDPCKIKVQVTAVVRPRNQKLHLISVN